MTGHTFF